MIIFQPQVITLSQLQNFLPPLQTSNGETANNGQGEVKVFPSGNGNQGLPTVVSVQGLPGQFFQVFYLLSPSCLWINSFLML